MNIYTNNRFTGFYPVGTAAVVVAKTQKSAARMLNRHLLKIGLPGDTDIVDMKLLSTNKSKVVILCDGEY